MKTYPAIKRGTWQVIRIDGTEEVYTSKPTLQRVYEAIGCDCIDSVVLNTDRSAVMLVDDTGLITNKPVNGKATELYLGVCYPGTVYEIHGDVAIVNDEDF